MLGRDVENEEVRLTTANLGGLLRARRERSSRERASMRDGGGQREESGEYTRTSKWLTDHVFRWEKMEVRSLGPEMFDRPRSGAMTSMAKSGRWKDYKATMTTYKQKKDKAVVEILFCYAKGIFSGISLYLNPNILYHINREACSVLVTPKSRL